MCLPNVGKVLEGNLNQIGIFTKKQLIEMGTEEAFIRIRSIDSGACLHMLYGLEGATQGVRYTYLSEDTKNYLKRFYNSLYEKR